MPHKKRERDFELPKWVERLADTCLQETVSEALWARHAAVKSGAGAHKNCSKAFGSAEKTLDQIEFGRVAGAAACRKAATALRKYNTAAECGRPTAKK